jgi:NAD(P)-dependent dehydrogenase (short-subunit alcohol dehydrogenase family)
VFVVVPYSRWFCESRNVVEKNPMKLNDRVAIVTGGGRAIGKQISLRLAAEGAHLLIAGPEADELEETAAQIGELGRQAVAVVADVSQDEDVLRIAARAREEWGRVDLLVNNAGIIGPTAIVPDVSRDDWDQVLAVNLTGAFLCCKAVLPGMIERRSGKVINISSVAGKMGFALRSPYAVSKWGLIGLTLSLAKEMGEHNIQVNAVCPGPVEGERMRTLMQSRAAELGRPVAEIERENVETTLLRRFVQADDIAAMVAFLASDEANNITGQALDVSGGYGI